MPDKNIHADDTKLRLLITLVLLGLLWAGIYSTLKSDNPRAESVVEEQDGRAIPIGAAEDKAAPETKAALVETQRLERELGFSWISGGPTDDGYIHIQEGKSLQGEPIIKINGSISVADSLIIDWGDGNTDSVKLQAGSREFTLPNHIYARRGEFEAYIQGTDTDGNDKALNFKVLVANAPPTIKVTKKSLISLDIETEIELQLGNTYLDSHFVIMSWGDGSPINTYSLEPGENTLSLKHTYTVGNEGKPYRVAIEVTDEGGHGENTDQLVYFNESFIGREVRILPNPIRVINSLSGGSTSNIALNDSQIFSLDSPSNLYSRVGIYDIPSDSWTYPIGSVTPYQLKSPALHVLDNGQVLIVGGLKYTSKGNVPNELTLIYDPDSQAISSVEVNPLAERLQTEDDPLWGYLETHLLGLANGKVLLLGTGEGFHNSVNHNVRTALATVYDPTTNSYSSISGDGDITYFYDSWCRYTDPIEFSDGRIFLGATIISSDLSTAVPIDLSNVDGSSWSIPAKFNGEPCYFASNSTWSDSGQILLEDDRVLFLSYKHSFMFEGNSFRFTKYQPPQLSPSGYVPTMYHDWDDEERQRRIIINPENHSSEFPKKLQFVYK